MIDDVAAERKSSTVVGGASAKLMVFERAVAVTAAMADKMLETSLTKKSASSVGSKKAECPPKKPLAAESNKAKCPPMKPPSPPGSPKETKNLKHVQEWVVSSQVKAENFEEVNDETLSSLDVSKQQRTAPRERPKTPNFEIAPPPKATKMTSALDVPYCKISHDEPTFDFMLADVVDPLDFYIHLVDSISLFEMLLDSMREARDRIERELREVDVTELESGVLLAVLDKGEYVRAEYLQLLPGDILEVVLVDYGIKKSVAAAEARVLPKEFCATPKMAVKCRLMGIGAPDDGFSQKAKELVLSFTASQSYEAAFSKMLGNVAEIDIFADPENEEGKEKRSLSLTLCEIGLAKNLLAKKENLDPEMENFDPMAAEYNSARNTYRDRSDGGFPFANEVMEGEKSICRFFRESNHCIRGQLCPNLHIFTGPGGAATRVISKDGLMTVGYNQIKLPPAGAIVLLHVSSVIHPSNFFSVLIWNDINLNQSEEEVEGLEKRALRDENLSSLNEAMTQHYRANRFQSKQASFIGGGEIVAAYKDVDEKWYRARVIETCTVHEMDPDDMNEQTCVIQFVDYGDKAVLPANELRRIEKRFLQLPFQAIECKLADLEPPSGRHPWSLATIGAFHQLIEGKTFAATVLEHSEDGLGLVLTLEDCDSGQDVAEELIRRGLAKRWKPTQGTMRPPLSLLPRQNGTRQVVMVPG